MPHVVVDGRRLEVAWFAAPAVDRPTFVLLHEGLGSVGLWRDFPARLAARTACGVVAYSRLGYGRSDPLDAPRSPDYMHDEAQHVLPQVLDALGIARPLLLGHSDGASIALIFAGTFPEVPLALVLEAPHILVEDHSLVGIANARTAFERTDLAARLAPYHDDPRATFRTWNDVWLSSAFRSWNIEGFLPHIRCPVLVIQGDDDEYGTHAQVDAIAKSVPTCETLAIPRCGHAPHRSAEAVTLDAIAAFVDRMGGVDTRGTIEHVSM